MISEQLVRSLPRELVDMIADYHDYDKHCKPSHRNNFKLVLEDIVNMSHFQCDEQNISANIALNCWGAKSKYLSQEYFQQSNEETYNFDDIILYY